MRVWRCAVVLVRVHVLRTCAARTGVSCLLVIENGCRVAQELREMADKSRPFVRGERDCALRAGCCCAEKNEK